MMGDVSKHHVIRDRSDLTIDKLSAAQEQLDESIDTFFRNKWLAAITLAGATEYMLPVANPESDLFEIGTAKICVLLGMSETEFIETVNEQRDWLKHVQLQKPVILNYSQDDVVVMILRAYLRLRSITQIETEPMRTFRSWVEQNVTSKNVSIFDAHQGTIK
jgi:hypothetical protein